jgi:hypothetical protein
MQKIETLKLSHWIQIVNEIHQITNFEKIQNSIFG